MITVEDFIEVIYYRIENTVQKKQSKYLDTVAR